MLNDPTPHRVSACPVHFIWDGRGYGRMFVRSGFFIAVGSLVLWSGARALHLNLSTVPDVLLGVGAALWGTGQLLSFLTKRSHP